MNSICVHGHGVLFESAIVAIGVFDEGVVVVVEPNPSGTYERNVYCVSRDGNKIWQIGEAESHKHLSKGYYAGLSPGSVPHEIHLENIQQYIAVVDIRTGIVLRTFQSR